MILMDFTALRFETALYGEWDSNVKFNPLANFQNFDAGIEVMRG